MDMSKLALLMVNFIDMSKLASHTIDMSKLALNESFRTFLLLPQ